MGAASLLPQNWLPSAVKSSGAVSPATLAIASRIPVSTPARALLRVTFRLVRQSGTPRASDASRSEPGTIFSCSSVVRKTMGIMIMESATAPAKAEKPFIGTTIRV